MTKMTEMTKDYLSCRVELSCGVCRSAQRALINITQFPEQNGQHLGHLRHPPFSSLSSAS